MMLFTSGWIQNIRTIGRFFLLVILSLLVDSPSFASNPQENKAAMMLNSKQEGTVIIKDFPFRSGDHFSNLRLHYITLGKPHRDKKNNIDNAVMLLHATINDATSFLQPSLADSLFAPNAPLDLDRFYIIIPDGIGLGKSTKPSDGLHGKFPSYGYLDQMLAHKKVLDHLNVTHLKMVLGTSMGGMQTWLWGETYPDSVDILVPIVSAPAQVNGRNFIWREAIIRSIRNDPNWQNGNYNTENAPTKWRETAGPINAIMLGTAAMLQGSKPDRTASIEKYNQIVNSLQQDDASDLLYVYASSYDYAPESGVKNIKAQIFSINFADDLINPANLLQFPELPNLQHVMLPGGYGHFTFAHSALWVKPLEVFLAKFPSWSYLR